MLASALSLMEKRLHLPPDALSHNTTLKKKPNKAENPECPSLSLGAMPNAMNLFGQKLH